MICQFWEVIEYGRASGLMAAVPDPFRPATRHRVRDDPNEDELGKALPETVIRQLDARLHLLGPAGRAGAIAAADLQLMHQTIYRILRLMTLLIMILSSCSSCCSYLTVTCLCPQRVGHPVGRVTAECGRDVGVALGLAQLRVPENLLHDADARALF
jgi:hypothetical protein